MVSFCKLLWVPWLLSSVGMITVGALLHTKEHRLCYEAYGLGWAFLAAGGCLVSSAALGSFALWKRRWVLHSSCVAANVLWLLLLLVVLTLFWGRQTTHLFGHAELSDWPAVRNCFIRRNFCHGRPGHVCCARPSQCDKKEHETPICLEFRRDLACFSCPGCNLDLFSEVRHYSRKLSPAIAVFSAFLLLVLSTQIVMEWYQPDWYQRRPAAPEQAEVDPAPAPAPPAV